MEFVMCRGCGEFVAAVKRNGAVEPNADSCPECDGTVFKDIHTDTIIRTDDEIPANPRTVR